ncbi:hypothetical protein LSTR_LSTR007605 [Laodelphax striatellus]|uniref:Uncharacterized protein n=1 Tax=Laodelphax striatellus TaxID=195883 RepID=A0A482XM90_LAOST|nr:hypothetical protein LSTR_LSTR007605 [Laodelphax striatellus]
MFARTHDPISYISPERAQASLGNMPVPVGMFMNMSHIPPRFYNQHQQALQARQSSQQPVIGQQRPMVGGSGRMRRNGRMVGGGGGGGVKGGAKASSSLLSQNSQDVSTQPYSQAGITQAMSQGMSQGGGGAGLSLSQGVVGGTGGVGGDLDSLMAGGELFHSQMDGLLSQDSTYQGDRYPTPHHAPPHYTQPY